MELAIQQMLKQTGNRYILLFFLVLASQCCRGKEILFSRFSTNDGLFSNFVNCVWQDSKGFLWVGTDNGLQRYDGNKFIQMYSNSPGESLPVLPVNQIVGDKNDNVWLRMGPVVGRYNLRTNVFKRAQVPAPEQDYVIQFDSRGYLLLKYGNGVLVYNEQKNAFEVNNNIISTPPDWIINEVTEDPFTHNFWISANQGLGLFDVKSKKFYNRKNNPLGIRLLDVNQSSNVLHVFIDSRHRYWITQWPSATGLSVTMYDDKTGKLTPESIEETAKGYHEVLGMIESDGLIWAFGNNLLNVYDDESKKFYVFYDPKNTSYGIKFNIIMQVYTDHDGNIWVASDNGLYKASVIRSGISHGSILNTEGSITFAKEISGQGLVIGIWGSQIHPLKVDDEVGLSKNDELAANVYKGVPRATEEYNNFKSPWDVVKYSVNGHLIFTCQSGKLIDYDPVKKRSQFLSPDIFNKSTIRQVIEDRYRKLWFGTQSGKLIVRGTDGNYKILRDYKTIIKRLFIDRSGLIWVAGYGFGIEVLDPGSFETVRKYSTKGPPDKTLSKDVVFDLAHINDTLIAVACAVNLDIINLKTGRVQKITPYQGLPQPTVYALQSTLDGDLWMSTNRGIVRYSFKTGEFRSYDQRDGLITTSNYENLLNTSSVLRSGSLVFAGGNSFVIFKPEAVMSNRPPKDVTITDIKLFNNYIRLDSVINTGGLNLRHNQNSITIQFASLSFAPRNRINYYYKLDGAGNSWTRAENSNSVSFELLPPGHYTFMVRCVNSEGLSCANVTSLPIFIKPTFWQTWWFIALLVIAAAGVIYTIYRLRINRLVAVQRLREKVARDLHDDMGSTLTSINILSEMASNKINGDNAAAREYMSKISVNSSQMMDAMDDIVWSIKPDNDTMPRIVARMREYAATVLEPKDIEYAVMNDEKIKNIKLDMDRRRNLFLIFKETLNNLVKYSGASMVEIEFLVHHSRLQLIVKDNGKGFDQKLISSGNGLTNMRNRAQAMDGSLVVSSRLGKGTLVTLEIPLT